MLIMAEGINSVRLFWILMVMSIHFCKPVERVHRPEVRKGIQHSSRFKSYALSTTASKHVAIQLDASVYTAVHHKAHVLPRSLTQSTRRLDRRRRALDGEGGTPLPLTLRI